MRAARYISTKADNNKPFRNQNVEIILSFGSYK